MDSSLEKINIEFMLIGVWLAEEITADFSTVKKLCEIEKYQEQCLMILDLL